MQTFPGPHPLGDYWSWHDTPGEDPEAVSLALPILGIEAPLDSPFTCVLPDHNDASRVASVSSRDLYYRCACLGSRKRRIVDVFAAQRYRTTQTPPLGPTLAAAWWGRLWIEAGLLTLDLPSVAVEADCPNRLVVERVLRGLVLLQGVYSRGGTERPLPCAFARDFVHAWCENVSLPQAWRSLETMTERGYVSREKCTPEHARPLWLYELTGHGLKLTRPVHYALLPAPRLDAVPEPETVPTPTLHVLAV